MQYFIQHKSIDYVVEPGQVLTIGRSINTGLRLYEDTAVSRNHCEISFINAGTLILKDQASENGTRINGRMVFEPTELQDGDVITVGTSDLKVQALSDKTELVHPSKKPSMKWNETK